MFVQTFIVGLLKQSMRYAVYMLTRSSNYEDCCAVVLDCIGVYCGPPVLRIIRIGCTVIECCRVRDGKVFSIGISSTVIGCFRRNGATIFCISISGTVIACCRLCLASLLTERGNLFISLTIVSSILLPTSLTRLP